MIKEAMESVSGTEYREGKSVMSNKEEDKEFQKTKEAKGLKKRKKHKDKGQDSDCEGKSVMSNNEECQITKEEKGQKKGKKHKDKGQDSDCEGKSVMSNNEECQITKEEKGQKKGKKHKDKGLDGDCEGKAVMSNNEEDKECQITKEEKGQKKGKKHKDKGRDGDCEDKAFMSNNEEKDCQITKEEKGQKKGNKHKDKGRDSDCEGKSVMSNNEEKDCQITKEEKGQKKGNKHKDKGRDSECEGKSVMGNKEEKECQITKEERGRKKGNKHKDKGRGSDCDSSIHSGDRNHSIEMEQAEVSAKMAENPCLDHAEGVISKSSVKKHRKKKKKDAEVEIGQNQVLDADENVGSEDAERNNGEKEHDSKSKKRKRKHQDDETALNGSGNKIVLGEDKRRKMECLVSLEEGNKSDMSKIGKKTESKKERRKERNNTGVDQRQNAPAGQGKDSKGNKEKKVCEDENDGGEREKENMAKRKDKGRRVSFTDDVEVFNIGGSDDVEGDGSGETELVHGQRFTSEEDAKLMEAMVNYAEMKQLGEKGLDMIGESKKHPEIKGCWAEIAKSLPHRPATAVYKRARILLQRSADRKWTEEEYEIVRRFVEKHGRNWRVLAKELGKNEIHVKDTWRRMKPKKLKKGPWTQDEYQNLFDLVNLDLRVKAHQTFNHGHRRIRDNISWEAISDKLTTRSNQNCCMKWYQQLASPLVKEGTWADVDDYLLVEALQNVDAVCAEDVDWENLLEHRSGELCRQRWNQMVRLIGGHRDKPFIEQVEVLARRYCPEMLAYRKPESCELPADELAGGSDL